MSSRGDKEKSQKQGNVVKMIKNSASKKDKVKYAWSTLILQQLSLKLVIIP